MPVPFSLDALGEVEDGSEVALLARLDHVGDRRLADALDRREAEADRARDGREARPRLVHVRRQHLDALRAQLRSVLENLGRVVGLIGHHRRVKVFGVMGLQVGGLVGDVRVGDRVRLVEAVVGELRHEAEDFLRLLLDDLVLACSPR